MHRRGKKKSKSKKSFEQNLLTDEEKYDIATSESDALKKNIDQGKLQSDTILETLRVIFISGFGFVYTFLIGYSWWDGYVNPRNKKRCVRLPQRDPNQRRKRQNRKNRSRKNNQIPWGQAPSKGHLNKEIYW